MIELTIALCEGPAYIVRLKAMNISDIEVGTKYKCCYGDAKYFGHVKEIKNGEVRVLLGDKLNNDGDPGDPIDRLDKSVWLKPENIHRMACEL